MNNVDGQEMQKSPRKTVFSRGFCTGQSSRALSGGEGSRTLDLLNAIQALSQLSYAPRKLGPRARFEANLSVQISYLALPGVSIRSRDSGGARGRSGCLSDEF